ncbi:hypothetical protein PGTUg99_006330 [Puccinia graminis f. sp. tritici]|uniref:Tyr recombinase domain-containing protein n=1 Tax=Puccinia graminis f. sp. tritici TaxID=56615 RepID=A0A5B0S9V5_PUCGR|nr:hypothetical protein PGTUg99_006330 [Puccinia graminis f. sp. tritici]
MEFSKISAFLSNGTKQLDPSPQDRHFLRGFKPNTLASYNAAVKKFLKFKTETSTETFMLPASDEDIVSFTFWAGRNAETQTPQEIAATTVQKYIFGLQAWHDYHGVPYPTSSKKRVAIMLRSSAKIDAQILPKPKKEAIRLNHLIFLARRLLTGDPMDSAILDLTLVAFWGMARLAELTYTNKTGPLTKSLSLLTSDAEFQPSPESTTLHLTLRNAKTAKPGEIQLIQLRELHHMLCPVAAVKRRLEEAGTRETSLFGYFVGTKRHHLTRNAVVTRISREWRHGAFHGLSGHSFRVGGASLRFALGTPTEDICVLGRWTSNCYTLYIRPYTPSEKEEATRILKDLTCMWKNTRIQRRVV